MKCNQTDCQISDSQRLHEKLLRNDWAKKKVILEHRAFFRTKDITTSELGVHSSCRARPTFSQLHSYNFRFWNIKIKSADLLIFGLSYYERVGRVGWCTEREREQARLNPTEHTAILLSQIVLSSVFEVYKIRSTVEDCALWYGRSGSSFSSGRPFLRTDNGLQKFGERKNADGKKGRKKKEREKKLMAKKFCLPGK